MEYDYYDPADGKFLNIENIVQYLFSTGIFNDIECRKILICNEDCNVEMQQAAIYEVMFTKHSQKFKKILEVFRNRTHPFQNPRILLRIFSYLKYSDIANCKRAFPNWEEIIDMLITSKYDQVDLEPTLLMHLLAKNEKIKNTKSEDSYENYDQMASVFQLMLAVNPKNDEKMLEGLQIGRDVNISSIEVVCNTENKIKNLIANALNNHTILSNVFQFLSLADVKNCRIVCRTWHSVSEPFLRKISTIKFDSSFGPTEFINISTYFPLPNLHFKAFKFRGTFLTQEVLEFFTKFGKKIQVLDLCLRQGIRSSLSHTSNLTELYFQGAMINNEYSCSSKTDPMNMIPLSALHCIKILYLRDTVIDAVIDADGEKERKRITPLKVNLKNVRFYVEGRYSPIITLNDYIDFTKVTDINVVSSTGQIQQFDWAGDTFHAKRITFSKTRFVNAGISNSAVDYLCLNGSHQFSEKNSMSIKQLLLEKGSISLTALPPSLEKLAICLKKSIIVSSNDSIYLPNLKYLSYRKCNEFHLLSHFDNCTNLTDLEIWVNAIIDIRWLPRNIRRLKVVSSYYGQLKFIGGLADEHFDLDLLILGFFSAGRLKDLIFDKVRPKVLVLEVPKQYEDEAFVSFIRRNKNMDKIYVRRTLPEQTNVFSGSQLSNIVDKESEYYVFNNERGKAITYEEFDAIKSSLDVQTAMKEVWNMDEEEVGNQQREEFYSRFQEGEEDY